MEDSPRDSPNNSQSPPPTGCGQGRCIKRNTTQTEPTNACTLDGHVIQIDYYARFAASFGGTRQSPLALSVEFDEPPG